MPRCASRPAIVLACAFTLHCAAAPSVRYFDNSGRDDILAGGVKRIEITTPKGKFHVWTKRIGNNPRVKVLLLHGGPGATHEYFEAFDTRLPAEGMEYFYYDQLGSLYSDQPDDASLWTIERFVDEVEQVRTALGLTKDDFVLLGQSWGGILAIEYALRHPANLKALVISNMMASIPAYNDYARRVLIAQMDPRVVAELRSIEARKEYDSPRYEELLVPNFYEQHILRIPAGQWPDPVVRAFVHLNKKIYILMQGPSEMGASGLLENWDRTSELRQIAVPTLVIGARYDTMDPKHMEWIAKQVQHGEYLYCPRGSHLAMYDDQDTYFAGLISFLKRLDNR